MQPFVLYNSEQRKKVEFVPRQSGHIDIYVCGMTVYDYCHIGHARTVVAFDYIVRFLRSQGWSVKYIRNITDIDDKIIQRAHERGENIQTLTDRFIAAMNEDFTALGCAMPNESPRATEYIDEMQSMIGTLVNNGTAYAANNGDVYFEVDQFKKYGRLSGRKLEDMQAGASDRVDVEVEKKHPFDFVLWKRAKPNEPFWASPWGNGRPGWHIECSAMSTCCLGNHFDIHGGGGDLPFPHHENEIAQSEAATGEQYVNYWMHVGFVNVDGEKMSKSLGNFFTIREVLEKFHPEVIRYFITTSHYRSPINFSDAALRESKTALGRFYHAFKGYEQVYGTLAIEQSVDAEYIERFNAAMSDDFNTPEAFAILFELLRELNRAVKEQSDDDAHRYCATLRQLVDILCLVQHPIDAFLQSNIGQDESTLSEADIECFIQQRIDAKKAKDFAQSDAIRAQLLAQGVVLEDTRQGTTWRRAD